jgi:protein MpaA
MTPIFIALSLLLASCTVPPRPAVTETGTATDATLPTAELSVAPVSTVPAPVAATPTPLPSLTPDIKKWCDLTDASFLNRGWGDSRCDEFRWNHVRNSAGGVAIPWVVFGDEADLDTKNVTLIMCGVHGDEITPVKFCYDILYDLKDFHWDFTGRVVVVAPLVSPDSYFTARPSRTNGRGVDVNRNFPTRDWDGQALKLWKERYRRDKRRFPGHEAMSEQEVIFQVNLIKRYRPSKIISVHSPLSMLDYDGPDLRHADTRTAKDLLLSMSEKAEGYKVSNYPHFPGSLGNWAGLELGIPTYTLELPNTDARQSDRFWKQFREAIHHAIEHRIGPTPAAPADAAASAKAQ